MTDHLSWETLNDLVDGMLAPAAASAVEAHARTCATCGSALSALRATMTDVESLPDELDPPPGLIDEIRATIEQRKVAHLPAAPAGLRRGIWMTPGRIAVAASALIIATSGVTAVLVAGGRAPDSSAGVVPAVAVSWQASEREFLTSVVQLREQLDAMHDQLAPETVVKVERALSTIDLAIAEAREALLRDPANAALTELLASNYRQKIELLRRTTQLASSS